MYKHILIPTDGSELAQAAVKNGVKLAKETGATVTFLTVAKPFHVFAADSEILTDTSSDYRKGTTRRAETVLAACEKAAKREGVRSEGHFVVDEHPYEAIIADAENRHCDLITMASHGRGGIKGVVLGSVTQKVLTHSRTPVLVYRPGQAS